MKIKTILYLAFFILILIVFKNWFLTTMINSGDYSNFNDSLAFNIYAWGVDMNGLGSSMFAYSWLSFIHDISLFILTKLFSMGYYLAQKIAFFYSFIVISIVSSCILFKKIFKKNKFYLLASLIFLFNTYSLMLVGGGQIFIALSLAFLPITLWIYLKEISKKNFINKSFIETIKITFLIGLILTFQIMLDLRIGYIAIGSIFLMLFIFNLLNRNKKILARAIFIFITPLIIVLLLNLYWILPVLIVGQNPIEQLGSAYSTSSGVVFFSFAKFENAISLLHPNWPENIFGKVYFLKPEFLILPILAFLSLFFIKNSEKNERFYILFFAFIGILGAFLAKGSNEPFGNIYLWMFNNFPGMQMFRDPTKFYTLIVLSYSMLIPYSISKIYAKIPSIKFKSTFLFLILVYLLFLIRPAIFGQLTGAFKTVVIPTDYTKLNNFISSQDKFARTLWLPTTQRFGIRSDQNPAVSSLQFFKTSSHSALLVDLNNQESKILLQEASVRYAIIPHDSEGEIFLDDRKYSEKEHQMFINQVSKIAWLKEVEGFGKNKVFEISNPKDHFWIMGKGSVLYETISPVEYKITLKETEKEDILVFSETFDKNWSIIFDDERVPSQKYKLFNSFKLGRNGAYSAVVYYEPQSWVNKGLIISGVSFAIVMVFLGLSYVLKKNNKYTKK